MALSRGFRATGAAFVLSTAHRRQAAAVSRRPVAGYGREVRYPPHFPGEVLAVARAGDRVISAWSPAPHDFSESSPRHGHAAMRHKLQVRVFPHAVSRTRLTKCSPIDNRVGNNSLLFEAKSTAWREIQRIRLCGPEQAGAAPGLRMRRR